MAINSFNINGTIEKYDYNGLENKLEIDTTLSESGKCAEAQVTGQKFQALAGNRIIYIQTYDANFGSVASMASAGATTFSIECTGVDVAKAINNEWTIAPIVISGAGAYGNPYTFYTRNGHTDGNKYVFELVSNAMNLSNAQHTLTVRFVVGLMAEVTV